MTAGAHRIDVLHRTVDAGLVAFVRSADTLTEATEAIQGGATVVSVRLDAAGEFRDVRQWLAQGHPDVLVGAETTAAAAGHLEAGADFICRPGVDLDTARLCARHRIAYLPLCADVSDLDAAEGAGVDVVGVAPAPSSRDAMTAAVRARPRSRILAIEPHLNEQTIARWTDARAAGIGAVLPDDDRAGWFADMLWQVRKRRGWPLFGPVEHVGLYANHEVTDAMVTDWYAETFDYPVTVGKTRYAGRGVFGRIEVMQQPLGEPCHIGVRVWNFDEAVSELAKRGRLLEEPVAFPASKLAYLRDRDPAGNLVHIIWRPS